VVGNASKSGILKNYTMLPATNNKTTLAITTKLNPVLATDDGRAIKKDAKVIAKMFSSYNFFLFFFDARLCTPYIYLAG
jgi:hypothetical protein